MVDDNIVKPPDQVMHKITVNGQEIEVSQKELIELAQQGKDYTKKTQALSEKEKALREQETRVSGMKQIVDEMDADPKLKETLNKVYSDYKSGKISKSDDNKDRNLKLIDKRIEEASDPATREQLKEIREIIREESPNTKQLEDKITKMENELALLKNATIIGQEGRVESQLQKLEERFSKDLVGKYRQDIKAMALKYPQQSVAKLLYHFADETEIETAILSKGKKKEKEDLDKKKRFSSPNKGDDSFVATTDLQKDKRTGRVTMESFKNRVLERLGRK